jgi:hypothetical protein
MKFKVTMKDPDTLYDAEVLAVKRDVDAVPGLSSEEREAVIEKRREAISEVTRRWFRYGEYLTVEIDTDARTARVCGVEEDD